MKHKAGTLVLADEQGGAYIIGFIREAGDTEYYVEWVDGFACREPYKEHHIDEFVDILEKYLGGQDEV